MKHFALFFFFLFFNLNLIISQAHLRDQPNIIMVLMDDLGYETAIQGDSIKYIEGGPQELSLPNLRSKLTSDGLVLNNAYATPTCGPSRVQLMTGKHLYKSYHQFGYVNWNSRTIAQDLSWNGYHTAVAGKWQMHGNTSFKSVSAFDQDYNNTSLDNPLRMGYQQFLLTAIQGNSNIYSNCKNYKDENGVLACNGSPDQYGPTLIFEYFENYINQRKNDKRPFFFDYRMVLPHAPFEPDPNNPDFPTDTVNNAKYLPGMLSYTDGIIGEIMNVVESKPELHEGAGTVVIILSDNGSSRGWITNNPGGDPMLSWGIFTKVEGIGEFNGNKSLSTYLGCHIPAFIYYLGPNKKFSGGDIYSAPVGLIDIYPTILDLAKLSHLKTGDGVSFADAIVDYAPNVQDRDVLFQYYNPFFPGAQNQRGGTNINSFATDGKYWLDSYNRFYDIIDSLDWELKSAVTPSSAEQVNAYNKLDSVLNLHPKAQDFNKPLINTIN